MLLGGCLKAREGGYQGQLTTYQIAERASRARATASRKFCGSQTVYDLLKDALFRRAAQVRGSDQASFDKAATYAVAQMKNPVLVSETKYGLVRCSASVSLSLPPGFVVIDGRRTVSADVGYNVILQVGNGGGPAVLLIHADAIVTPLATLRETVRRHRS